jgi:hypothetical protein
MKDAERRDKKSVRAGEKTRHGKRLEPSRNAGDAQKMHRWPVNERQPER